MGAWWRNLYNGWLYTRTFAVVASDGLAGFNIDCGVAASKKVDRQSIHTTAS